MKRFSKEIQKYRFENNISQEKFANIMNVSRQLISKWETGSSIPNSEDLLSLSKLFNIGVEELLDDVDKIEGQYKKEQISKKINIKKLGVIIAAIVVVIALAITLPIVINNNNSDDVNVNDINNDEVPNAEQDSNENSDATEGGNSEDTQGGTTTDSTEDTQGGTNDNNTSKEELNSNLELINYSSYIEGDKTYISINQIDLKDVSKYVIPSEIDGMEVTKISNNAIINSTNLIELTIPFVGELKYSTDTLEFKTIFNNSIVPEGLSYLVVDSTQSIPSKSFSGIRISKVVLTEKVKKINSRAFEASNIQTMTLPSTLESIGLYAFNNSSLTDINLPNANNIGVRIFNNCTKLKNVEIAEGITEITEGMFSNCATLKEIKLPSTTTKIGSYAFSTCETITSIIIPNSVTTIESGAFCYCKRLKSVTLPDSLTSIDSFLFSDCTGLTTITLPNSVSSIGNYAFSHTSIQSINIPSSVVSLGESAFANSKLSSIELPATISSIGIRCFDRTKITNIDLSLTQITKIEDYTFYGCLNLTNVKLSNMVTHIGIEAFYNCTSITEFVVPSSVVSVKRNAFSHTMIKRLTIMNPNANVEQAILYENEVIEFLQLPNLDYRLGLYFSYEIPDSLSEVIILNETELPSSAFSDSKIKKITLPNNLITINFSAFEDCTELEELNLPDSITTIGTFVFEGCLKLKSLTLPLGVTEIGYSTFDFSSLIEVVLHKNITKVSSSSYPEGFEFFYMSNEDDWNNVTYFGDDSMIYFYSEEEPSTSGNYWYYDIDGNVCKW